MPRNAGCGTVRARYQKLAGHRAYPRGGGAPGDADSVQPYDTNTRHPTSERILVIIPTYNEKENIDRLIPQVLGQHPQIEVLVVDDNSPDRTGQVVEELARATSRVHLLARTQKLGLGTAYVAGFQFALDHNYELVLEMDADFSHAPGEIPRFLQAIQTCDLVVGSRYMAGGAASHWPRRRQWLSPGANLYARWLTGLPLKDATSGYRCFRRRVLERDRPGARRCQWLRLPDRDGVPRLEAGIPYRGNPDCLRESHTRQIQARQTHPVGSPLANRQASPTQQCGPAVRA
jgi:hypothetical protein